MSEMMAEKDADISTGQVEYPAEIEAEAESQQTAPSLPGDDLRRKIALMQSAQVSRTLGDVAVGVEPVSEGRPLAGNNKAIVPGIDPLTDISIVDLSNELGWPALQVRQIIERMRPLRGEPLSYDRQVGGAEPVVCVSHGSADTLRQKLGYRMNQNSRPLTELATENTFPTHAYEKLIAAAGLRHAIKIGLDHPIKIGRTPREGMLINARPKIPFITSAEAEQVGAWSSSNPEYPLLTLQQFLIASGCSTDQTIGALHRLTDFSSVSNKNTLKYPTEDGDFRPAQQYLADKSAQYEAVDGGVEVLSRLQELFVTNANTVLPAQLVLKWIGIEPRQVLRHAPAEKDPQALRHLEDIFINYVAALIRPSMNTGVV